MSLDRIKILFISISPLLDCLSSDYYNLLILLPIIPNFLIKVINFSKVRLIRLI